MISGLRQLHRLYSACREMLLDKYRASRYPCGSGSLALSPGEARSVMAAVGSASPVAEHFCLCSSLTSSHKRASNHNWRRTLWEPNIPAKALICLLANFGEQLASPQ